MPNPDLPNVPPDLEQSASVAAGWAAHPEGGAQFQLVLRGEIDMSTIEPLYAAAGEAGALARSGGAAAVFWVDLAGVTFLDSSGLHFLEDTYADLSAHGWAFHLVPPAAAGPARLVQLALRRGWLPAGLAPPGRPPPGAALRPPAASRSSPVQAA